jgi:hypothetical protein
VGSENIDALHKSKTSGDVRKLPAHTQKEITMTIELKMKDGRVKIVELPKHAWISSEQLAILIRWAIEGRPAQIIID